MTIKELLQYRGNKHYFCCLCQDEEDKMFVIFARADSPVFESTTEYDDDLLELSAFKMQMINKYNISIPLIKNYYIMSIKDYKDYELINNILEVVWMGDE